MWVWMRRNKKNVHVFLRQIAYLSLTSRHHSCHTNTCTTKENTQDKKYFQNRSSHILSLSLSQQILKSLQLKTISFFSNTRFSLSIESWIYETCENPPLWLLLVKIIRKYPPIYSHHIHNPIYLFSFRLSHTHTATYTKKKRSMRKV